MKTKLIIIGFMVCGVALCQTDREMIGAYRGGGGDSVSSVDPRTGMPIGLIQTQDPLYSVSIKTPQNGDEVSWIKTNMAVGCAVTLKGKIWAVKNNYIVLDIDHNLYSWGERQELQDGQEVLIENYWNLENAAEGQTASISAIKIGTIKSGSTGRVYEFWHDISDIQAAEREKLIDALNQKKAEELTRKKKLETFNRLQGQTNAVHFLQPEATNGDDSAQCELGLHYLNGQGCETNVETALYWLKKSAAQGNQRAAKKLASLEIKQ